MTVQCPQCHTQYRVPESRLSKSRPVFRCARCDLVFTPEQERPIRSAAKKSVDNLSFDFQRPPRAEPEIHVAGVRSRVENEDGDGPSEDEPEDPEESLPAYEPAFLGELATEVASPPRKAAARPAPRPVPRKKPPPPVEEEEDEEELEEEREPVIISAQRTKRSPPIEPRARAARPEAGRSPLRPIGIAVALIAAFYLFLAVALDRNPALALDQLSRVPVLGQLLGQDHLLAWRLEVNDLAGGLDYIRDNRLSYVVSGRAVNTTGQDLRIVEVEGSLVADGQVQRRQRVYAANQARSTIRDLSPSEVEMLLRLEPNRRFVIHPGESASFLLVFPNPPTGFNEVAVRVVDARTP